MKLLIRYAIQFFAGVGMFAFSSRAYFLVWEYYARNLPRPYEAYEFIDQRATIVMAILFVIYQLLAYAGMRVAVQGKLWKSN
jgi:hypothetical protein